MRAPRGVYTPGDHISASATLSWDDCAAAFWFDRVLRIPAPDRSYFLLGSCLHRIQELQLNLKLKGMPTASETEVADLIRQDLEVRCSVEGAVKFTKHENKDILIEDAIAMAQVWMREVMPQIEPFGLEVRVGPEDGLRLPGSGTPVIAYIDVIASNAYIRDLKSAKAKWPEGAAEAKLATFVYWWAFRIKFGERPAGMVYDVIVRKKRNKSRTTAQAEYHPVKVQDLDPRLEFGALRRMEAIVAQMKAGQYYPTRSYRCDDCAFAQFCADHFAQAPFAPWLQQQSAAPADGPRYITVGGTDEHGTGNDGGGEAARSPEPETADRVRPA